MMEIVLHILLLITVVPIYSASSSSSSSSSDKNQPITTRLINVQPVLPRSTSSIILEESNKPLDALLKKWVDEIYDWGKSFVDTNKDPRAPNEREIQAKTIAVLEQVNNALQEMTVTEAERKEVIDGLTAFIPEAFEVYIARRHFENMRHKLADSVGGADTLRAYVQDLKVLKLLPKNIRDVLHNYFTVKVCDIEKVQSIVATTVRDQLMRPYIDDTQLYTFLFGYESIPWSLMPRSTMKRFSGDSILDCGYVVTWDRKRKEFQVRKIIDVSVELFSKITKVSDDASVVMIQFDNDSFHSSIRYILLYSYDAGGKLINMQKIPVANWGQAWLSNDGVTVVLNGTQNDFYVFKRNGIGEYVQEEHELGIVHAVNNTALVMVIEESDNIVLKKGVVSKILLPKTEYSNINNVALSDSGNVIVIDFNDVSSSRARRTATYFLDSEKLCNNDHPLEQLSLGRVIDDKGSIVLGKRESKPIIKYRGIGSDCEFTVGDAVARNDDFWVEKNLPRFISSNGLLLLEGGNISARSSTNALFKRAHRIKGDVTATNRDGSMYVYSGNQDYVYRVFTPTEALKGDQIDLLYMLYNYLVQSNDYKHIELDAEQALIWQSLSEKLRNRLMKNCGIIVLTPTSKKAAESVTILSKIITAERPAIISAVRGNDKLRKKLETAFITLESSLRNKYKAEQILQNFTDSYNALQKEFTKDSFGFLNSGVYKKWQEFSRKMQTTLEKLAQNLSSETSAVSSTSTSSTTITQ